MTKVLSRMPFKTAISLFAFVASLLLPPILMAASPPNQSRYAPGVVTLANYHHFFRTHDAPTFWKLNSWYVTQKTESSCSLATAVMVVNAARSPLLSYKKQSIATGNSLLQRVNDRFWEENVKPDGNGVTLSQFKLLLEKSLRAYGVSRFDISMVHTRNTDKDTARELHKALVNSEATGQVFLIANFDQKRFINMGSEGHFSPVAAYDSENRRVLIMDSYRQDREPYWVPEDVFLQGMATYDTDAHQYRGYLVVRFKGKAVRSLY